MSEAELPSYIKGVQSWLSNEQNDKVISDLRRMTAVRDFEIRQFEVKKNLELQAKIRPEVAKCPGFWPYALMQNAELANLVSIHDDQDALSYLTDVELQMDAADPREYSLIFTFKENPYFSNEKLTKKYVLAQPDAAGSSKAGDGAISDEMLEFDLQEDLKPVKEEIKWKSDEVNLLTKFKRNFPDEDENEDNDEMEMDGDLGSFFWWFDDERDPLQVGQMFVDDILPRIVDHFLGLAGDDSDDDEDLDSDEEEDDEDEDEIDLEEEEARPSKKAKRS